MPKRVTMPLEMAKRIMQCNMKWKEYQSKIRKRQDFFEEEFGGEIPPELISARIAMASAVVGDNLRIENWNEWCRVGGLGGNEPDEPDGPDDDWDEGGPTN